MKKIAATFVALLAAVGAQAATVSYSYGLPLVEHTTEINETGSLGLFDSSLGTLTGAMLTIYGAETTSLSMFNNAATQTTARASTGTDLTWSSTLSGVDALLAAMNPMSLTNAWANHTYAAGASFNYGSQSDSDSSAFDLASILASVQANGGGNFGVSCESLSFITVLGGGGNVSSTQTTTAGCGATISYEYTAAVVPPSNNVPEPGSLALISLGLIGIVTTSRRRKV